MSGALPSVSLVPVTDYGLGSFAGNPLVLVTQSLRGRYHRHDHRGRISGVTFTEAFIRNDWGLQPCRVCWPEPSHDDTEVSQ